MANSRKSSGLWAILIFLNYLLISLIVSFGQFRELDLFVTNLIQSILPRSLDIPLSALSVLGTFELTLITLILTLWGARVLRPHRLALLIGFGVLVSTETAYKHLLVQLKPPSFLNRYNLPISFPTSSVGTKFAFPSGHMARSTYMIVIYWYLTNKLPDRPNRKIIFLGLFSLGLLMAAAQIYLGGHWLSDIFGGMLLGFGISFCALRLIRSKLPLDS